MMKRLLTCLFLVTALVFNISTKANAKAVCVLINDANNLGGAQVYRPYAGFLNKINKDKHACENYGMDIPNVYARVFIDKKKDPNLYKRVMKEFKKEAKKDNQPIGYFFNVRKIPELESLYKQSTQTQKVVKKEPTQTQQVAELQKYKYNCVLKNINKLSDEKYVLNYKTKFYMSNDDKWKCTSSYESVSASKYDKLWKTHLNRLDKIKQAKTEPTQTQQVAKKEKKKTKKIYLCGEKSYREVSKMYNRVIISKIPCKKILSWRWKKISGKEYVKRVLDNYGNNAQVIQSLYDDFQRYNLDTNIIKKITKVEPTQTQQVVNLNTQDKIDKLINEKNFINQKLSEIEKEITALEDDIKKITASYKEEEDPGETSTAGGKWHTRTSKRKIVSRLLIEQHDLETSLNKINKKIHFAKTEPTQTQQVAKIDKTNKSFSLFKKEEKKITIDEVVALGTYQEFESYPEGMLKEFGQCNKLKKNNKQFCRGKKSGKKVYEYFVKRGERWHQRHPGDIIHGMAWFEIIYLEKLRKNTKQIARYLEHELDYSKKGKDIKALHSLIKMNKGRIKMREALGLSLNDDLATVLNRHWLLGDFLNNNELKVAKVKLDPELKKRKKLLKKYQSAIKKYNSKLKEESEG